MVAPCAWLWRRGDAWAPRARSPSPVCSVGLDAGPPVERTLGRPGVASNRTLARVVGAGGGDTSCREADRRHARWRSGTAGKISTTSGGGSGRGHGRHQCRRRHVVGGPHGRWEHTERDVADGPALRGAQCLVDGRHRPDAPGQRDPSGAALRPPRPRRRRHRHSPTPRRSVRTKCSDSLRTGHSPRAPGSTCRV